MLAFLLEVFNSSIAAVTLRSRSSSRFLSSKARGRAAVSKAAARTQRQLQAPEIFPCQWLPIGFTTPPCKTQEGTLGKAGSLWSFLRIEKESGIQGFCSSTGWKVFRADPSSGKLS